MILFYIHINAFLRKTISKAITRPNHAHMYSDHGYSSVFVNWTKQVCLQTRLKWWQWWGTPNIIWNRVPDRRRKRKWTITKCCLTACRSIKKRHGVWVEWVLRVCNGFLCSMSVTHDGAVLLLLSYHRRLRMILRSARAARGRR